MTKPAARTKKTFAKPKTQADRATKKMWLDGDLAGLGSSRTYSERLTVLGTWMKQNGGGALQDLTFKRAKQYLALRATQVSQKTLDADRQAIQALLRQTGKLGKDQVLRDTVRLSPKGVDVPPKATVIKSAIPQQLKPRAYSPEQVHALKHRMAPHNSLSVEIAHAAGLRAHELFTLARLDELAPDKRPADSAKFAGREAHSRYVVTGKGGLIREVSIPSRLAERLEALRLAEPRVVRDRGILYEQRYAIGGGQALSEAFSRASRVALGYSSGAHGVRHSYAQQRHYELQVLVGDPLRAKRIVSQEIGHHRPEITDVYLR